MREYTLALPVGVEKMPNNLVDLSGYLEIGSLETSPTAARSDLSLSGWIHAIRLPWAGQHPFPG